jgi:protein-L-isoaspartate O-methyltransferase
MAPPQPGDSGMTPADEADVQQFVERYVHQLKTEGAIRSPAVERAFRTVQRHRLLETFYHRPIEAPGFALIHHDPEHPRPEHLELIYANTALATRVVDGMPASSTSQPSLVAQMLELLDLTPGLRVLEIGAGTGYNAALMAELVGDQRLVVTVDVADDVVAQTRRLLARAGYPGVAVLLRDGVEGARAGAVRPDRGHRRLLGPLTEMGRAAGRRRRAAGAPGARRRPPALPAPQAARPPRRPGRQLDRVHAHPRPPPPRRAVAERDPATGRRRADPPARSLAGFGTDEVDFCFYLSLLDRRACWAPDGVG